MKSAPSTPEVLRGRAVAGQGPGGECNMTTFILLSNLNWTKMLSGLPLY